MVKERVLQYLKEEEWKVKADKPPKIDEPSLPKKNASGAYSHSDEKKAAPKPAAIATRLVKLMLDKYKDAEPLAVVKLWKRWFVELSRDSFTELSEELKKFQDAFSEWDGQFSGFMSPAIKAVDAKQGTEQQAAAQSPAEDIQTQNPGGEEDNG